MFQVERQEKIVQILEERPRVTVEELAKQLGVTAMTIRRDLKYLESVQIVSRTFGGAVLKSKLTLELPRQEKEMQHQAEKERIGQELPLAEVTYDAGHSLGSTNVEERAQLTEHGELRVDGNRCSLDE